MKFRSLSACEGALLLIDASPVEAQALANAQLAVCRVSEIIPVINKIDLPSDVDRVSRQIEDRWQFNLKIPFLLAVSQVKEWMKFWKLWWLPPQDGLIIKESSTSF